MKFHGAANGPILARLTRMQPAPRHWNVLLDVRADASVTIVVAVEGRTLLPACGESTVEGALKYLEHALSDAQRGDTVECMLRSSLEGSRFLQVASRSVATLWIAENLIQAVRLVRLDNASPPPDTGTRLKAQPVPSDDRERDEPMRRVDEK